MVRLSLSLCYAPAVKLGWIGVGLAVGGFGCVEDAKPRNRAEYESPISSEEVEPLEAVARIHGAVGPFAVAGYRIGRHAIDALQPQDPRFGLAAWHASPAQVQLSCVADGVQAATGVSMGKLSLQRVTSTETVTFIQNRDTGETRAYRLTRSFLERFSDLPEPDLAPAGQLVLQLPEEDLFTVHEVDLSRALSSLSRGPASKPHDPDRKVKEDP